MTNTEEWKQTNPKYQKRKLKMNPFMSISHEDASDKL